MHNKMVFSHITTLGKLPDGRIITTLYSYPEGTDYETYMALDDALVIAFGTTNARTIGQPFNGR